jgi:tyrosyl-tRNA synthetase
MKDEELLTRSVAKVIPTDVAKEKLKGKETLRVYWGIDPTSTNIHLGHTIPMRKLKAFADAGHHAIFLIGSFTAMLGDPSDKESMRQPLTRKEVEDNMKTYKKQAEKVIDFSKVEIVYNHEWLEKLTYADIMKHTACGTVPQLLQRDAFEKRLKAGKDLGVHEFLYPFMVGYDSVYLDVDCEIGGTDQEFNMLMGRTMQKRFSKRDKFVLTTPLIPGTDGRLMSKTYDNCVWLTDPPNEMYGKLMSINDDLITLYMECCTDSSMEEINEAENAMKKGDNPRDHKARLARDIVTMYYSENDAKKAEEEFETVFQKGGMPDDINEINVKKGSAVIDVLVENALASSKGDARRLIEQGGVKCNDTVIDSVDAEVTEGVLRVGKRKFLKVSLS